MFLPCSKYNSGSLSHPESRPKSLQWPFRTRALTAPSLLCLLCSGHTGACSSLKLLCTFLHKAFTRADLHPDPHPPPQLRSLSPGLSSGTSEYPSPQSLSE
ncbi:unnamed protein product [Rangifer tarandus platyrhynchus]|uniref:Uncharacterized protein n=2 Tax=Rangifer tarandus platyrhynchus TaxID=3082113 RepID=A0ABN9A3J4_RANTA|nr:unnamed protein product [Rangifer tarandus platyrhynchus]